MNCYRVKLLPLRQSTAWPWLTWLLFSLVLMVWSLAHAENGPVSGRYETSHSDIIRLAADLRQALEPRLRACICSEAVVFDESPVPVVRAGTHHKTQLGTVRLSAGFVALLNYLSHAKAIDGVDRGFYERSIASLAVQTGGTGLPSLDLTHKKAWSFDTLNHQGSHFNQMAGGLVAIELAHHYLGHYKKYASQLIDTQGQPVPLSTLISPDEWHDAIMAGTKNALACGLGVEGLKVFFDGLEKTPNRPAWSLALLPAGAQVTKLNQELQHTENDFFLADTSSK
jgi:hypothetical protein